MIYVSKDIPAESHFIELLEGTKQNTLEVVRHEKTGGISPDDFETLVYEKMCVVSKGTNFEGHVIQTGAHAFPDIVARQYYGAEVKMTTGDKWVSTGNSILETTRLSGVEKIYMFFGKFGGNPDIKFRPYAECLNDIGVTHSPRYKINMNLAAGHSIFDKMNLPYDELRNIDFPIKKIKEYFREQLKEGQELWWIDSQADESTVSPIIQSFRELEKDAQERFIVESMILFPEIFGSSTVKFERVAAYLITNYNAVSSSLRDIFTAGGQQVINVNGVSISVPKIFYNLKTYSPKIAERVNDIDLEKVFYYWRTEKVEGDLLSHWLNLVDRQSEHCISIPASDIFRSGYEKEKS